MHIKGWKLLVDMILICEAPAFLKSQHVRMRDDALRRMQGIIS